MRLWIKDYGMRQKDLATLLGITPQDVTKIFKGAQSTYRRTDAADA
jgi:predicted XRE-type DNA-binding protein